MTPTLLRTGVAVGACAALGSAATRAVAGPWYAALHKPAIQPPTAVFPVAWTALYADLAVTSARALDALAVTDAAAHRAYVRALAANLVLNAGWCWVSFRARRLGWAVGVAALLTASSVDLVRRTARADPRAGTALSPYAGWCGFATVLSGALWRANRGRSGA